MEVPELTIGEFETFSKSKLAFIDFFAEWCMPCMMMTPIVDDLAEEFRGKVEFGKINIEDLSGIADKFNVNSIPHFILLKNGKKVEELTGSTTQDELSELIRKHL